MSLDSAGKHAITATVEDLAQRKDLRALIINPSHWVAFLVNVAELSDMQEAAAADFSRAGHPLANTLERFLSRSLRRWKALPSGEAVSWCSLVILRSQALGRRSVRLRQWAA